MVCIRTGAFNVSVREIPTRFQRLKIELFLVIFSYEYLLIIIQKKVTINKYLTLSQNSLFFNVI
jgi:hypothetical protein